MIEILLSHLAKAAAEYGRSNPVVRYAPTSIAVFNITGRIVYNLFRLNPSSMDAKASSAIISQLQYELKDIKYIIINEKSILSLLFLSQVESRCRKAKPNYSNIPFGSINVILFGDFA